jgi:hypothetical protein
MYILNIVAMEAFPGLGQIGRINAVSGSSHTGSRIYFTSTIEGRLCATLVARFRAFPVSLED